MATNAQQQALSLGDNKKAGLGLSQTELRALQQTHVRLQNLTSSLASFKHDLHMNMPLPNPQSLQASAAILKNHTNYLLDNLTKHSTLFQRLSVHPSTTFPGRTQENVQTQLLRKKLDPAIETLVEAARDEALAAGISPDDKSFFSQERLQAEKEREKAARRQAKFGFSMADEMGDDADSDSDEEGSDAGSSGDDDVDGGGDRVHEPIGLGDVWVDCVAWSKARLAKFATEFEESLYTAEEREMGIEHVRTGLRRNLEEEEDEDEDEEDDEEDEEGDTAMRDSSAPVVSGVGPTSSAAGQTGLAVAGPTSALAKRPEEDVREWMMAFQAYSARGEDSSASLVGGLGAQPQQRW